MLSHKMICNNNIVHPSHCTSCCSQLIVITFLVLVEKNLNNHTYASLIHWIKSKEYLYDRRFLVCNCKRLDRKPDKLHLFP